MPDSAHRPHLIARGMLFVSLLVLTGRGLAQPAADELAELSLEELVHVEITTLGRKSAAVFDTPAPAYIISGDEINRFGALSLPEALRLAPGVQVGRIDAVNYAITIRGFNDASSNKLLVQMDGRSVYNPLFTGANWSFQEAMLADVSRIEVQRGPAGPLWGANAVNGVINLVTKNAHSTTGSLVSVARGDHLDGAVEIRHGWNLSPAAAIRVYAKYQEHDGENLPWGAGAGGWNSRLLGARLDWDRPGGGSLMLLAEHRELRVGSLTLLPLLTPPYSLAQPETQLTRGASLSGRWIQPVFADGRLSVQLSLEKGELSQFTSGEKHTIADLDVQLTAHPWPAHELIAGATVWTNSDNLRNSPWTTYRDVSATSHLAGIFAQDEITLQPDRLTLTLGAKVERSSYSGWEPQPGLRLLWHPEERQTLWAAVSRAARTPSRTERDVSLFVFTDPPTDDQPFPVAIGARGHSSTGSEQVTSWEVGHRFQPSSRFSLDTALYYSRYTSLRGLRIEIGPPDPAHPPLHVDYAYAAVPGGLAGHTYGGEFSARWRPSDSLQFDASVATVSTRLHEVHPGFMPDPSINGLGGNTPRAEFKFHAAWEINARWSADLFARRTGRLRESLVPAYTGLDLRLGWQPRDGLRLELIGRDLLDPSHPEASFNFIGSDLRETARSVFLRCTFSR